MLTDNVNSIQIGRIAIKVTIHFIFLHSEIHRSILLSGNKEIKWYKKYEKYFLDKIFNCNSCN